MTEFLAFTVVGVVTGGIYAVAASGLVVTYTTSGIFNFAHGAIGMFMAFVFWELHVHEGWPTLLALLVVLLVLAPLFGAVLERVLMRQLHGSPTGVSLVMTLALLVALLGFAQSLWSPKEARTLSPFFAGHEVKVFGVVVSFHELTVVAVAALTAILLRLLLTRTRIGVTMRAVVDDRELSGLYGARSERVAQLSWALGAVLAAAAGILLAPTLTLNHLGLTLLVVNGYAAAMLGRLRSLPLTFVGALILGLAEAYAIGYGSSFKLLGQIKPILPTILLFAVLLFLPQARLRAGRLVGARTPKVPGLKRSVVSSGAFVLVVAALSTQLSLFWTFNVAQALVFGMVLLSLVLLTGYASQVSLMQMTFVGVGAVTMGRLASGSPWGLLLAGLAAAAFGAAVSLPAQRLQDLYLALATLALASFGEWAFNQRWLLYQGGILAVRRLRVPGFSFKSEQSQLILVAACFAVVAVLVLAIRRSAYGRRLAAMSDSPVACATLGLNLFSSKTTVFALSAGIAGVAGALYGGLRTSVSSADFVMLQSLFIFLVAIFGGINTVGGALFGGVFLALVPELQKHVSIQNIEYYGIALGAMTLARRPNGVAGDVAQRTEQLLQLLRNRGSRGSPGSHARPAALPEGAPAG